MNLYLIFLKYVSVLFDLVPLFVTEYPPRATPICSKLHHLLLSAVTQLALTLHPPTHTLPAPLFPSLPSLRLGSKSICK